MGFENSPFLLENKEAWEVWRRAKRADYPLTAAELMVEVEDPRALTEAEHAALLGCIRKTNMALYRSRMPLGDDPVLPRILGRAFGLTRLDHNYLAENNGVSAIAVGEQGVKPQFIPYTDKPLRWHTDGYYNDPADPIRAFILHCVQPAAEGGENALLDHELVYLLMREAEPAYVKAMLAPDMMSIPPREDEDGVARPRVSGPVFLVDPATGALQMRYTARKRNIEWRDDPASREALAWLEELLAGEGSHIFRHTLGADEGLLCNNVIHAREGFTDAPDQPKRLLYRARYFDRIAGS